MNTCAEEVVGEEEEGRGVVAAKSHFSQKRREVGHPNLSQNPRPLAEDARRVGHPLFLRTVFGRNKNGEPKLPK